MISEEMVSCSCGITTGNVLHFQQVVSEIALSIHHGLDCPTFYHL